MDPSHLKQLDALARGAYGRKVELTAAEGIGSHLPPVIALFADDAKAEGILGISHVSYESCGPLLAIVIGLSGAGFVVVVGEAYVAVDDTTRTVEVAATPELAARFATGDPDVLEAVYLTALDRRGSARTIIRPFTYKGRKVRWRAEHTWDEDDQEDHVAGPMTTFLREGFAMQSERNMPPLALEAIGACFNLPSLRIDQAN